MNEDNSLPPITNSASSAITSQLKSVNEQVIITIERLSKVAEKGPVNFMLSFGAGMIIFSMLFKVEIGGFKISNLSTAEFITTTIVGAIITISAATIKFYQFYVSVIKVVKEQQKLGSEIVKQVSDTATEILKQKPSEVVL